MDLHQEIMKRTGEYIESPKFHDHIQSTVEKTVNEAVSSMLSYGEIRDAIRAGLKEKVAIDMDQIDFPALNTILTDMVKRKCHAAFEQPLLEKLGSELDDMFQPAPKTSTIQQLIDIWKEDLNEDCSCDGVENILVEIEQDEDAGRRSLKGATLKIWDEGTKKEKPLYSSASERDKKPDLHIYFRENGKIAIIHDINEDVKRNLATCVYGKEAKLFMMYCAGTIFTDVKTVDPDNLDTNLRNGY